MNNETALNILAESAWRKAKNAIALVEASISTAKPYEIGRIYSPKEREPYDALSDRFVRAVEISVKFFKTYERFYLVQISENFRDVLNQMEKLEIISSVSLWVRMRDVCNRIVHDYLPSEIKGIYDSIVGEYGKELLLLSKKEFDFNI